MASSEKVVSPGVFTNEIDQTFLPAAVADIGAALIGPTVKGPAGIPTIVNSYSDFRATFGDVQNRHQSSSVQYLTSHAAKEYLKHAGTLTVVRILAGAYTTAKAFVPIGTPDGTYHTASVRSSNLIYSASMASFTLHTLSHGALMNTGQPATFGADVAAVVGGNNVLTNSGSADNLRWEVTGQQPKKGTFSLIIRRGDDSIKRKKTVETWNNVSLDPNSQNYIAKVIGDTAMALRGSGGTDPYLQPTGSYPNKSKYVRVEVNKSTPNYLDENGDVRIATATGSLPGIGSGSFSGGSNGFTGFDSEAKRTGDPDPKFYDEMVDGNSQGFDLDVGASGQTAYEDAINLLSNQDEYDINLVLMPGVTDADDGGAKLITKAVDMCEDRGDCFVVADPTLYNTALTTAATKAEARDSSYGAMYYPWIQIADSDTGANRWVPPSTVMGGVYAFNDKVAHPWFAPAGLNRGGIDMAIQAERKLTHANRDTLYESNVNPIATFPGQGICVWGQKTLQKKASALDRVNVRRLLIKLKKFIAGTSRFLVFEQNTAMTRNRFLNIVNPYMEQVQSNSGLNAFRVVMDDSNNTPDLVDRNILYGQIFIQPTRTAEFIVLDFTVQPTGATFPE
jgi:hypothetical protein